MTRASLQTARLLLARGQGDEASRILDEVLEADPSHEEALLLLAERKLEARAEDEAIALSRRAVALWPRSALARSGLARCLHAVHDDDAALLEAQEARRLLDEGDNARHAAPVYLTLVWCLREKRLLREALAAAEEGLARVGDAVLAHWAGTVEEELASAEQEEC
ncbi:MAG TPA: tetratricopeptide repeat protein [Vicinamibacteria bacterium]